MGIGGGSSGGSSEGMGGIGSSSSSSSDGGISMEEAPSDSIAGGKGARDGRWVDAEDWSQCDKTCGGGKQIKQRFCIPPSGGGKQCKGNPMLERLCATQPCPEGGAGGAGGGAGGSGSSGAGKVAVHHLAPKSLPMQIVMKQVSKRPQRYEECVVREGDICVVRDDFPQFKIAPRLPARAVLNLLTFSVYENANFDSIQQSYVLSTMKIKPYPGDIDKCFTVTDGKSNHALSLCACDFSKSAPK